MKRPASRPNPDAPPTPAPVAVGYSRQSRTRAADLAAGRVVSPELQNSASRGFAVARAWTWNEELTALAVELNTSGGTKAEDKKAGKSSWRKRRGLALLLEAAQRGEFQHLVVYKLSRLARSAREGLEIFDTFEALGVSIHVASEGIDYSTATGRLLRTIMLAVAEMELENIREFAVDAAFERATQGKHHGRPPGWIEIIPAAQRDASGEQYRLLEPHATSMQELVRLRVRGFSFGRIARELNLAKLPTRLGGEWTMSMVGKYLQEDFRLRMRGTSVFGTRLDDGDPRRILIPNAWPPLLDEAILDELDAVQRTLTKPSTSEDADGNPLGEQTRARVETQYLLSGLVSCAICGSRMYTIGGTDEYRGYACFRASSVEGAHVPRSGVKRKRSHFVAGTLEEAVVRAMGVALGRFGGQMLAPRTPPAPRGTQSKPKRTLEQMKDAEDKLFDAYTSGVFTKKKLDEQLARIDSEREAYLAWETAQHEATDHVLGWATFAKLGSGEEIDRAELRLALQRTITSVEVPVEFEEVKKYYSRNPVLWVRIRLTTPLPDGTEEMLAAIHRTDYTGPRHVHFGPGVPTPPRYNCRIKNPGSRGGNTY